MHLVPGTHIMYLAHMDWQEWWINRDLTQTADGAANKHYFPYHINEMLSANRCQK